MGILDFLKRKPEATASVARERLRIIVAQERSTRGAPDYLPLMRNELLEVIKKYVHVDLEAININFERDSGHEILELSVTLPEGKQAAKGAILNVSKNVACTQGQDGIRSNSLHPGYIVTPMNKDQGPVIEAALIEGSLLKRAGQPIEIAYAALFLASDEASYVTGTSLVVDGGYLAP